MCVCSIAGSSAAYPSSSEPHGCFLRATKLVRVGRWLSGGPGVPIQSAAVGGALQNASALLCLKPVVGLSGCQCAGPVGTGETPVLRASALLCLKPVVGLSGCQCAGPVGTGGTPVLRASALLCLRQVVGLSGCQCVGPFAVLENGRVWKTPTVPEDVFISRVVFRMDPRGALSPREPNLGFADDNKAVRQPRTVLTQ